MSPPVIWTSKRTGTKTRRMAEARFHQLLYYASHENNDFLEEAKREVPEAWLTLELDMETAAPKKKVSLYLDEAVVKMYRAMGPGYQGRINRILETWMQMKIAEKAVFQKEIMERVEEAREDKTRPEPETFMEEQRAKLVEHWAYETGGQDAVKAMG